MAENLQKYVISNYRIVSKFKKLTYPDVVHVEMRAILLP